MCAKLEGERTSLRAVLGVRAECEVETVPDEVGKVTLMSGLRSFKAI